MHGDPLVRAVERLWQEQRTLLPRWAELRRSNNRTPYEEGELRVLEARVRAVRSLSQRFCTILRDEAWDAFGRAAGICPRADAERLTAPETFQAAWDSFDSEAP